jgi:hypothetical protein
MPFCDRPYEEARDRRAGGARWSDGVIYDVAGAIGSSALDP